MKLETLIEQTSDALVELTVLLERRARLAGEESALAQMSQWRALAALEADTNRVLAHIGAGVVDVFGVDALGGMLIRAARQAESAASHDRSVGSVAALDDDHHEVVPEAEPPDSVADPAEAASGAAVIDRHADAPESIEPTVRAEPVPMTRDPLDSGMARRVQDSIDQNRFASVQAAEDAAVRNRQVTVDVVRGQLQRWGASPTLGTGGEVLVEANLLIGLGRDDLAQWEIAATEVHLHLASWLAARLRALQTACEAGADVVDPAKVDAAVRRLTAHSKMVQVGVVHGLARKHMPKSTSWTADAQRFEELLRAVVAEECEELEPESPSQDDVLRRLEAAIREAEPASALRTLILEAVSAGVSQKHPRLVHAATYANALDTDALSGGQLKRLRREVRAAAEPEGEPETEASRSAPAADWPGFAHTDGLRVVMVGGEPRRERIEPTRNAFRFASLEWVESSIDGTRRIESLVESMNAGNVDLVITLRAYSSHVVSEKLFRSRSKQCRVILSDNYTWASLQRAIARNYGFNP